MKKKIGVANPVYNQNRERNPIAVRPSKHGME
jgi:hypothetical protein